MIMSFEIHLPSKGGIRDGPHKDSDRSTSADVRVDASNHSPELGDMPRCTKLVVDGVRRLRRPQRPSKSTTRAILQDGSASKERTPLKIGFANDSPRILVTRMSNTMTLRQKG